MIDIEGDIYMNAFTSAELSTEPDHTSEHEAGSWGMQW
jgi:hypothetical protein